MNNQITPEQILAKVGILVMENDLLRAELGKLQQEKTQLEKAGQGAKSKDKTKA